MMQKNMQIHEILGCHNCDYRMYICSDQIICLYYLFEHWPSQTRRKMTILGESSEQNDYIRVKLSETRRKMTSLDTNVWNTRRKMTSLDTKVWNTCRNITLLI